MLAKKTAYSQGTQLPPMARTEATLSKPPQVAEVLAAALNPF